MKPNPIQRLGSLGDPDDSDEPKGRWPKVAVAIVAIAVIAGVGGYVYERFSPRAPVTSRQVPLIKADDSPTKIRPEEPGGMAIPDQDKLVYQALGESGGEEKVERILPPPEEPIPLPPDIEPAAGPVAVVETAAPAPAVPEPAATSEPVAEIPPPPEASPEKTVVAAVPPAPAPATTPPSSGNGYLVQLAALRSAEAANEAWRQIAKANADLLGALRPKVVRADLGAEKGVFFRLRAGPLRDEAAAKGLCAKLKARKADCLVVRP